VELKFGVAGQKKEIGEERPACSEIIKGTEHRGQPRFLTLTQ
jgi:hypothetical protein